MNTITRKGSFDAGHRVMNERFKCFNFHGHTYLYELTFAWKDAGPLGYAIDFKEIKRVACQWIDDTLDHGFIANPADTGIISLCLENGSKVYLMNLKAKSGYCNPTAENIAKEIFYAVSRLMNGTGLRLSKVTLHETPNCLVECQGLSDAEIEIFKSSQCDVHLLEYKLAKGVVEYDDRNAT